MAKERDFDTQVVELVYGYKDENGVIHKEAEIREMMGSDEEDIQKPDIRGNVGRLITKLLANCVVRIGTIEKESVKPSVWENIMRELYLGDRDLLMLEIRKFTYGEDFELPFKCPHCKAEGKNIMEWDEITVKQCFGDPARVPFELKKGAKDEETGERVKSGYIRMPKGIDQELLDTIARKNMGQANTSLITRVVESLGNIKLNANVIKKLSTVDREKIIETISENTFGPDFRVEITCPSCGEEFDTGVHPVNFL